VKATFVAKLSYLIAPEGTSSGTTLSRFQDVPVYI